MDVRMCAHVSRGLDGSHVFNRNVDTTEEDSRLDKSEYMCYI